jgi:hypothetical protein
VAPARLRARRQGKIAPKHLTIEEEQRLKRLVLGRRADLAVISQMGQELLNAIAPNSLGCLSGWKWMYRLIQ